MFYKISILLLLLSLRTLYGQGIDVPNINDLKHQTKLLSSPQTVEATSAFDTLYKSGSQAIPFLIDKFSDKTDFVGICGASSMTGQAIACETKKTLPDGSIILDCHNKKHVDTGASPKVRDVALYLIISILKSDKNHSKLCAPKSKNERDLRNALSEIKKLYMKSNSIKDGFNITRIESILEKYCIKY